MQKRRILFALIVAVIIILDQYTKSLATQYLKDGSIVRPFGGDFLWLIYVGNPGFAFGIRILPPVVLKIFAAAAALFLGYFLFTRSSQPLIQNVPFSMVMGGAIGNLIDRIRIGEVIDFVSVDTPDFIMDRFPVFNVADSMVFLGVVFLLLFSFVSSAEVDQPAIYVADPLSNANDQERVESHRDSTDRIS